MSGVAPPLSTSPAEPIVSVSGLRIEFTQRRRSLRVLNGIDLSIARGSLVAVLGPSGCGKSTFLRVIAGLLKPTSGEVHQTFCTEPSDLPLKPVNMAFQNPVLMPWLTVEKNALLPYRVQGAAVTPDVRQRLNRLLFAAQLFGFRDALPKTLSGGMQMRAALVRSFITQPELLLMDEPFAALDEVTRQSLADKLAELWAEEACTIIFVTHNIQEAVYLADRVLVFSSRPARVIYDCPIDFPRPRTPRIRETPKFNSVVHELYRWIGHE